MSDQCNSCTYLNGDKEKDGVGAQCKNAAEMIVVNAPVCYNLEKERGDCMLVAKPQEVVETSDTTKLEFYRLIGEGYKAMQDGRTSTIEEVQEKINQRRAERG